MSSPLMLILGIVVLLLGLAFIAGWFDWLLRVGGVILVIIGAIGIVMGIAGMMSNRNNPGRF